MFLISVLATLNLVLLTVSGQFSPIGLVVQLHVEEEVDLDPELKEFFLNTVELIAQENLHK